MGVKGRRKRREEREKRRMRERGRVERVMGRRRRGGWNVVQTENAVHAVLYLVRVFVNGSVRMRRREMEYRGRIFVVVYVGAIAVLFRFVVMMLNGTGMEERKGEKEEGVGRRRRRRRGRGGGKVREEEGNQRWREKVEWVKRRDKRGKKWRSSSRIGSIGGILSSTWNNCDGIDECATWVKKGRRGRNGLV